jgi:L-alanine-DL-glutamate epimerase-like enolase superfamily enzyme
MRPRLYVYDYDNEPADERPTGFGETHFGHSGVAALSTTAAWNVSQHSTFDEPSRSAQRVQAYRKHGLHRHAGLIGVVLLALAVVSAALALALNS